MNQIDLKEILYYCPESGDFTWLSRSTGDRYDKTWNSRFGGKSAGTINKDGYISITIKGKVYTAHRLAFLYMQGIFPSEFVDHKDRDRLNNKWSNIRKCTREENARNTKSRKNSSSRFLGVHWSGEKKKWRARISSGRKYKHLGYYDNEVDAARAYNERAGRDFGEFANLNEVD